MESRTTDTVAPDSLAVSSIRILTPGCEVGERYEVRSVLGIGGSGVVYAVFDREVRRNVALKVLRSDRMSESTLKRFRREVAVARDAQSPHLVRVFDMAQSADSIYLTMELVKGESLARRLERGPLPAAEAVEIGSQILLALEALHAMGIVHRDIKPSNVMLSGDGVVKLTDFGLARRVDSETRATETESVVGTYEYLSPEQALGDEIDARSDLYSFGILMFECLTGDVPLRSGSSLGTVIAHVSKPIPHIRTRNAAVPRWLGRIIQGLLEKRPGDRYQAAADVRRDLARRRAARRAISVSRRWMIAAIVIVLASGAVIAQRVRGSRFEAFVHDGKEGGKALNRRGEVLWSHPFLQPSIRSVVATMSDGSKQIVGIDLESRAGDVKKAHHLMYFDPQSGAETASVDLPRFGPLYFPADSETFEPCRMTAVDIDHDGAHEVVTSFCHHPSFPCYAVIVDSRRRAAFPVLIASGHHRLVGTLDVDGDGRDELIFGGPSNRLGWFAGVAAVRVDIDRWESGDVAVASTPDKTYTLSSPRVLLWYALVGKGGFDPGLRMRIDAIRKQVVVELSDHSQVRLDVAGFEAGTSATPADAKRRALDRTRAYEALRHAMRLSGTGYPEEALPRISEAVAAADRARDIPLGIWARRVQVRICIRAGKTEVVDDLLRNVQARFETPADASFDAANEFHMRGDLESALRWYRDGLARYAETSRGRMSWEIFEGEVFALAGLKRWQEAKQLIEEFTRSFSQANAASEYYAEWIEWRRTDAFPAELPTRRGLVDFSRYAALESSAERPGADPDALIARIDREINAFSGIYKPALVSLKAELLERKGDHATAMKIATAALAEAQSLWSSEAAARIHTEVIAARVEALRKAGGGS